MPAPRAATPAVCLAASAVVLLSGQPAAAASGERAPGLYLNFATFAAIFFLYLFWLWLCNWVDRDLYYINRRYKQRRRAKDREKQEHTIAEEDMPDPYLWNGVIFGCGLLGLILFWLVPWFFLSFPVLLALCLVPAYSYIQARNALVPKNKQVLTVRQFKKFLRRNFGVGRKRSKVEEEEEEPGPDVVFLLKDVDGQDPDERQKKLQEMGGYEPAAELLIEAVLDRRADEIFLEPSRNAVGVRFSVDGLSHTSDGFRRATGQDVIAVFKRVAELEINERRKPQEGRFAAEVEGEKFHFRIKTAGSVAGEKVHLRVSEPGRQVRDLSQTGMSEAMQEKVKAATQQDHGLFLTCGPAESGSTSTAYACLMSMDRFQTSIMTLEDPIDEKVPNTEQVRLNARAGETVLTEMVKVLRHQPHVILIGELTDKATAEEALKAAAEEVMVISTLHAPDALTGLFRLLNWGVPPAKLAKALTGVISQRLVRVLCPDCKVRYRPDPRVIQKANLPAGKIKHFYRPPEKSELERDEEGKIITCETCGGIGYRGRTGVFELLLVNDRIRMLLTGNPSLNAVKQEAVKSGMVSLQERAMELVMEGTTSITEVLRVFK